MEKKGFQFKQFFIEHTHCAMKVGTDSIMLGSWAEPNTSENILDIGTGSGLLAIMLAQKATDNCRIYGIDIDPIAIEQAKLNAKNCPWYQQLLFELRPLQALSSKCSYDLIISNPPYFPINTAANKKQSKNTRVHARQTITLEHQVLLAQVIENLAMDGRFYCVLPFDVALSFIESAQSMGLFCIKELQVSTQPQKLVTRALLAFSLKPAPRMTEKITIYNELGEYSEEYCLLCKDYYLNF
ncbi:methyltransferase domain-containing protein [uncultured Paraglaciecola sp.]|uniref:tRNA1(Val) (adenine(37)-N6)-methyltransferase n=1 Tax=uncultured Paraglaciecola sp. TaxID=1765024 RepID=UPI002599FF7B|nr:methyltransferase domain-containing protein [uncultured Paraglaciecola sp.]